MVEVNGGHKIVSFFIFFSLSALVLCTLGISVTIGEYNFATIIGPLTMAKTATTPSAATTKPKAFTTVSR